MLRESARWAESAEALAKAAGPSDASYILQLLSFELLLKALVEEHSDTLAPKHHRYADIFGLLPEPVRADLLKLVGERIGPSGISEAPLAVLEELGRNFSGLRYPWERYEGLSEEQYAAIGDAWHAADGPLEQAVFRYHPEELYGLTYAARTLAGC